MPQRTTDSDHHSPERPVRADDSLSIDSSLPNQSNEEIGDARDNNSIRALAISQLACHTPFNQSQIIPETPSSPVPNLSLETYNPLQPHLPVSSPRSDACIESDTTATHENNMRTQGTPVIIANNIDSLDSSDVPFSQENNNLNESESSSESCRTMSETDLLVTDSEILHLSPSGYMLPKSDSGPALCEDLYSRLYYDYDEERYTRGHWLDVDEADDHALRASATQAELELRAQSQQNGGLDYWHYDNPFEEVTVQIDDVNRNLEKRFILEANTILDRVVCDITSREESVEQNGDSNNNVEVTPLQCLRSFVNDCLLEKLRFSANRALYKRQKKPTNKDELLGLLILHVLCASYNESPTVVCNDTESDFFFQMGISAERYHEVWSCLSGANVRRATHDYSSTGWCRSANRSTTMITDIESEVAAINRDLVYVQGASVLSLDDDHLRMASRAIVELSYLRQHNNPKKGLGTVGNALCSALNPFFIACHFTRTGEKLLHTWERLVQLLQGASTTGALRPMPDAIFAADRGYNSKDTISFLSDVLGASLIGTYKRDLWYPYVFGDGPISKKHRGMDVSEKGCRAVYTARLKNTENRGSTVRVAEACLYRESCSGRIAALIHNNRNIFPSRGFTIVSKESFRQETAILGLQASLILFDESEREKSTRRVVGDHRASNARKCVSQLLEKLTLLTYLQSEDPVWFLLRAFRFTSRTAHSFVSAICRDFDNHMNGLSWSLRGKTLRAGSESFSSDAIIPGMNVATAHYMGPPCTPSKKYYQYRCCAYATLSAVQAPLL